MRCHVLDEAKVPSSRTCWGLAGRRNVGRTDVDETEAMNRLVWSQFCIIEAFLQALPTFIRDGLPTTLLILIVVEPVDMMCSRAHRLPSMVVQLMMLMLVGCTLIAAAVDPSLVAILECAMTVAWTLVVAVY